MATRLFRHPDGALPNTLALSYALTGYAGGLWLMASAPWPWALVATLWFAHALILSAYLFHEFAHGTIFTQPAANTRGGVLMTWLTGSCYARYESLRRKHMRHHVDRADVISLDTRALLQSAPAWVRRAVLALEWVYVPAVELLMHAYVIVLPFLHPQRRADRGRVLAIVLVRSSAFATLAYFAPRALFLYVIAYLIMISVLRFADAFQHTYDAYAIPDSERVPADKLRDKRYEQSNTYSNLASLRWPWLNLLLLNFPFHNAHHEKPTAPWYRLPALHRELYGDTSGQAIPMAKLLLPFHRHRMTRVLADDYGEVDPRADHAAGFVGAVAVSFLTAV
ncbi:MAG: fatty acid desaturase [Thiobacillus sp.]|nr:fatty acid desaturase [Thiobacillus sp.]MDP3124957.1 fatty acid desaturase [Thiobacillus sp.]